MGEITRISKVNPKGNSLKSVVPHGVVAHLKLKDGDHLDWEIESRNGGLVVIVKPVEKND